MNAAPPETEYAFWTVPETSFTITYALGVFHEIDFQVNEGYRRIPHGGVEIGGLLFGHTEADTVRVEAFRTIECEHASGPSFVLSERDLTRLREQLSAAKNDPDLLGLDAVGWFVAHTRNPLRMLDREAVLFDELFAAPGGILVLIKPERFQPTRFSFLVRSADGSVSRDAAQHAVILPLPGRVTRSGNDPVPSIPAPEQKPAAPPIAQPPAPTAAVEPVAPSVEAVAPPLPPPEIEPAALEQPLPSAPVPAETTPLPVSEPIVTEEAGPIPEAVMAEEPAAVLAAEPKLLPSVVLEKEPLPIAAEAPEQVEEITALLSQPEPELEPEPEPELAPEPLLLEAAKPEAVIAGAAEGIPQARIEEPASDVAAAEMEPGAPELAAPESEPAISELAAAEVAPHVPEVAQAELPPPTEIAAPPPEVALLAPELGSLLTPAAPAEPTPTEWPAARPETLPSIEEIKRRRSAKQSVEPPPAPQYAYELSRRAMHPGLRLAAVLTLAAALGCAVGYWAYRQLPGATIALNVQPQPPALVVSWPPQQTRDAKFAAIRVDDGEQIALTPEQKEAGQAKITAAGDSVKIELFAQHWIRDSRGLIRYVKAAPASEASIQ